MIGFLNGEVIIRDGQHLIIETSGIGYKVFVPKDVLSKTNLQNSKLKLFIYTHVREDTLQLFGFQELSDLKLFENLISVSGIGPKTAMGIFNVGARNSIIQAILTNDLDFFIGVPRLGRKNAQKIIIELKSKLGGLDDSSLETDMGDYDEIVLALRNFGFKTSEIKEAVRGIKGQGDNTEDKIKLALKFLGK